MDDFTVVLLGTGAVGKSSITMQFIKNAFSEKYDPTIEEAYDKKFSVDDKLALLHVIDTAGQEEFYAMRDVYLQKGDAFMMVYSIDQKDSLEECQQIWEQIDKAKESSSVPCVLVGNKCDLESHREVTKQEGEQMAKSFGDCCSFFEASAKTGLNVNTAFETLVRNLRNPQSAVTETQISSNTLESSSSSSSSSSSKASVKKQRGGLFASISNQQDAANDLNAVFGK